MIEKFKNRVSWFLSHSILIGVCTLICTIIALLSYFDQHNSKSTTSPPLNQPEPKNPSCIEKSIEVFSQNEKLDLSKSSGYLSGCYVDGCYTYQLKITKLIEIDISNQYLKGLDWHVGLSILDNADIPFDSTVIKIRSNGRSIDEIKRKNAINLDEKVHVWLDSLNICNKEKHK